MKLATLEALNEARRERRAIIAITDVASGAVTLVREDDDYAASAYAEELATGFRSGASALVANGSAFLNVHVPSPRLVVIGAVHISQALAPMAAIAGFDVTIIDPRTAFATPERFPDVRLLVEWPQDALAKTALDPFTAVAALTHDPKIDDPALAAALAAGCFYVGALGSRKTHGRRIERLAQAGVSAEALARIHAPIGLSIRARSPAEIAVAVLAEIIGDLRSRGLARQETA
jgi:xanthine dehydrogenase accessory factor